MKYAYAEYIPAFKALSDETRLKIIDILSGGEMCACDLLEKLSVSQSTLSYHIKLLVDSGLVKSVRDGAWIKCTLNQERVEEVIFFVKEIITEKQVCICKDKKPTG